jgi:hypothetical protein
MVCPLVFYKTKLDYRAVYNLEDIILENVFELRRHEIVKLQKAKVITADL